MSHCQTDRLIASAAGLRVYLLRPIGLVYLMKLLQKCSTPCVELPTMCYTFSDSRHFLVDVSTFTSCVTLPHLGSVPLYVYPLTAVSLGNYEIVTYLLRSESFNRRRCPVREK